MSLVVLSWLGYVVVGINQEARWLRIRMKLLRENASISLGQVAIWGEFSGEIHASLSEAGKTLVVGKGNRFDIPPDMP